MQGLATRGGAHRGVADGGGARPESARESGLPVAGGGGPGAGSGGEAWALERRGRRGVETGGQVEQREWLGGSAAEEKRGGKGEGATRRGGVVGPGPDRWMAPSSGLIVALAGDVRRACVAGGNREARDV
jgi:hypothetical protein